MTGVRIESLLGGRATGHGIVIGLGGPLAGVRVVAFGGRHLAIRAEVGLGGLLVLPVVGDVGGWLARLVVDGLVPHGAIVTVAGGLLLGAVGAVGGAFGPLAGVGVEGGADGQFAVLVVGLPARSLAVREGLLGGRLAGVPVEEFPAGFLAVLGGFTEGAVAGVGVEFLPLPHAGGGVGGGAVGQLGVLAGTLILLGLDQIAIPVEL